MSAHDAEDMANAMLRYSPLPGTDRSDEELLEDGGSDKLLEDEDDGEKLPEGSNNNLPEETPAGNLVPSCIKKYFLSALNLIK